MATVNQNDYCEVVTVHQTIRTYDIINARAACNNMTIKLLLEIFFVKNKVQARGSPKLLTLLSTVL